MYAGARLSLGLGLVLGLTAALAPAPVSASDFWDEVRTPGLRVWRQHTEDATESLRAREWLGARSAAEAAAQRLPERSLGHVLLGLAAGELDDGPAAIEAFERALALDPAALDKAPYGPRAAELSAAAGAYDLAARILERALASMEPTFRRYELYGLYGDVLQTLGPSRLRDSILAYREALRGTHPVMVQATLGLALALRRSGSLPEAIDRARQAAGPGRVEFLVSRLPLPEPEKAARRAVAHDALGDIEAARRAWTDALAGEAWRAHAKEELTRLSSSPSPRRPRARSRR